MTEFPTGDYIVAGASGLVGSHALTALADKRGIRVKALYNTHEPYIQADNITAVKADLTQRDTCQEAIGEADYLLLAAGVTAPAPVITRDPVTPAMNTLLILSQSLEAAWTAGIRKTVWLSSSMGYPESDTPLGEEDMFSGDPPDLWYPIAWVMRYVETLSRTLAEKAPRPMTCIVLRPSLIYGEFDHFNDENAHFLPALLRRVVERNNPIEVWGDGENRRDVIHAADVVAAVSSALHKVEGFDVFNIANGATVSVNEVLSLLIEIDGFQKAKITHQIDRPSTPGKRLLDVGKAKRILGFSPAVELRDGLQRTLEWYRQNFFEPSKRDRQAGCNRTPPKRC